MCWLILTEPLVRISQCFVVITCFFLQVQAGPFEFEVEEAIAFTTPVGSTAKPEKERGRGRGRGRGEPHSPTHRRGRGRGLGRGASVPATPVAAPGTPAAPPAPVTPLPRRGLQVRPGKDDSEKIEKHLANCDWLQILLKQKTKADLYQARRCQKDLEKHTRLEEAAKFDEPLAVGGAAAALLDISKTPWEQVQVPCSLLQHSPFEH